MEEIEDGDPGEVDRLPAEIGPGRGRVNDRARQVAERYEVVRALDDEPPYGVVDALNCRSERLRPAARCSAPPVRLFARRSLHDRSEKGQSPERRLLASIAVQSAVRDDFSVAVPSEEA